MARDDPQINIRIPAGLKDRLERQAAMSKRSTTAEIVDRLNRSFHDLKLPPKLVVRLEVLREGPSVEVPVLDFFRSMSKTLRDQISEQLSEDRKNRRFESGEAQDDKTLGPTKDRRADDAKVVDRAAKEVALERAKRQQRLLARQEEKRDEEPEASPPRSTRKIDPSPRSDDKPDE